MKHIFLSVCSLALSGLTVLAAPLDRKDVAADPAVISHVDIDALLASSVGKAVLANPDVQAKLAALVAAFNFDLRTQLHGVTAYTTADEPTNGVLMVYADFDSNRLVTLAKAFPGFETSSYGSQTIYSWLDEKNKTNASVPRVYAVLVGHRVIFSKMSSLIPAALDVIAGKSPAFTSANVLPETDADEKVILIGAARRFAFESQDPKAAILKMSKSVGFSLGQLHDNVRVFIHLQARNEDAATQISQIATGLLALLRLNKDATVAQLVNAIQLNANGNSVTLALSVPSAQVIDFIAKHQPAKQETSIDNN